MDEAFESVDQHPMEMSKPIDPQHPLEMSKPINPQHPMERSKPVIPVETSEVIIPTGIISVGNRVRAVLPVLVALMGIMTDFCNFILPADLLADLPSVSWSIAVETDDDVLRVLNQAAQAIDQVLSVLASLQRVPYAFLHGVSSGPAKPRVRALRPLYEQSVSQHDLARFQRFLRFNWTSFQYVCNLVQEDLQSIVVPGFANIEGRILTVELQVAMAIRRLATGDTYLSLSTVFGVGVTTVWRCTKRFVKSITIRGRGHLQWPNENDVLRVKEGFRRMQGLPNCCGAIDCTHFVLELPPGEMAMDWFSKYRTFTMALQAIVGPDKRFLDVVTGWPGTATDTRILTNSSFYHDANAGRRLQGPSMQMGSYTLPEYIIGDVGYPNLPWLVTPALGVMLPPESESFNYKLCVSRAVVEEAFRQLKSVWRLLGRKAWRGDPKFFSEITYCCCTLHNIMIDKSVSVDPRLFIGSSSISEPTGPRASGDVSEGLQLQQALMSYLWEVNELVP